MRGFDRQLTPLHLAALNGHKECVVYLLAQNARTDIHDSDGETALEVAAESCKALIASKMSERRELLEEQSTCTIS